MPNHMNTNMFPTTFTEDFSKKSVLLIGAGEMASNFAFALNQMNINNVTIISKTEKNLSSISDLYNYTSFSGGYEKNLKNIEQKDLVIIATPTQILLDAAKHVLDAGHETILLEKPGSLYSNNLLDFKKEISQQRIRVGWQRILYPSIIELENLVKTEGGITSCTFNITEWAHTLNLEKYSTEELSRWGIVNPLHVLTMVFKLIGLPKQLHSFQNDGLEWHPTGSSFVGSGVSEKNIPFSYHGDWKSSGRWEITVYTNEHCYNLLPIENLSARKKGSIKWNNIDLNLHNPKIKQGIFEELGIMFDKSLEKDFPLCDLTYSSELIKTAETIFGYT